MAPLAGPVTPTPQSAKSRLHPQRGTPRPPAWAPRPLTALQLASGAYTIPRPPPKSTHTRAHTQKNARTHAHT